MNKTTRKNFQLMLATQASIYDVKAVTVPFTVTPEKEQRLIGGMQQTDAFLKKINMVTVDNMVGDSVIIGVDVLTAGRTNTKLNDRKPNLVHNGKVNGYSCQQTNFDTALEYAQLDAWGHKPQFKQIVSEKTMRANSLSLISMGFNGTSIAADTDIDKNPLLQDCAVGWLQKLKNRNSDNYLDSKDIVITKELNIDVLVNQTKNSLGEVEKHNPDLIVILGSELFEHNKDRLCAENATKPSEKSKTELKQVIETFGGLPAYGVPFFPARGILVTTFENLSIYIHSGSMRRRIEDQPKCDRVVTYSSKNIDYVVENLDLMAYIDSSKVKFEGES
ncbi:phage major capsid protein, P2 family [Bathymodiolus septemdierum thioautotrophic gill symbiont]|uniref:Phage major capsid protein, P2 family n=1 Tax=endosymbiont of Bathymodiolus septemdierum str. Myojin knoll TaxID=1303921 RepID=A0A0P0UR90_9GAMM|nr:phage major capsid protein, P2 family [Bathymodiolus septemdierum thioautotrophic gill symbiont]BAS67619.1 phage major capsid protein, P2 family [endosymbiont of Bathymodiolus septemdierum str. Myojin knoll]